MPVVAVIAAVGIDAFAVGAVAAGTLTTFGAITAIGATLGAIGAVTKNKTLAMVGMGLGIVGGIGSLASNAGLFGGASDVFGEPELAGAGDVETLGGEGAATGADTLSDAATTAGAGAGAATTGAATAGADITTATGGLNLAAANPVGAINSTSLAPAEGNAAGIVTGGDTGSALAQSLTPPATPSTLAGGAGTDTLVPPSGAAATEAPDVVSHVGEDFLGKTDPNAVATSHLADSFTGKEPPGMFGRIMDWAGDKNHALLSYGIIQAGGSFISGLTNPLSPAQINALNAQADANRATAALALRQTTNQGQALPTASSNASAAPVTGTPAGGLINTRPVAAPPVTGTAVAPLIGAPA